MRVQVHGVCKCMCLCLCLCMCMCKCMCKCMWQCVCKCRACASARHVQVQGVCKCMACASAGQGVFSAVQVQVMCKCMAEWCLHLLIELLKGSAHILATSSIALHPNKTEPTSSCPLQNTYISGRSECTIPVAFDLQSLFVRCRTTCVQKDIRSHLPSCSLCLPSQCMAYLRVFTSCNIQPTCVLPVRAMAGSSGWSVGASGTVYILSFRSADACGGSRCSSTNRESSRPTSMLSFATFLARLPAMRWYTARSLRTPGSRLCSVVLTCDRRVVCVRVHVRAWAWGRISARVHAHMGVHRSLHRSGPCSHLHALQQRWLGVTPWPPWGCTPV